MRNTREGIFYRILPTPLDIAFQDRQYNNLMVAMGAARTFVDEGVIPEMPEKHRFKAGDSDERLEVLRVGQ